MADDKPWREKEELEHYYWNGGMSTVEMGDMWGCSHMTVYTWMKKHDVPRRDPGGMSEYPQLRDEELLRKWYEDESRSFQEIADEVGCGTSTVGLWVSRHGIDTRQNGPIEGLWDEDELRRLYVDEKMSTQEIGEEFDCAAVTVLRALLWTVRALKACNRIATTFSVGPRSEQWLRDVTFPIAMNTVRMLLEVRRLVK